MENQIKNYSDLLAEETKITQEIQEVERKIEESFEIDIRPKKIMEYVKSFIPFSFDAKTKTENKTAAFIEDSTEQKDDFFSLAIDLAYESISLLLFKRFSKETDESTATSKTSTSIQLILKSMTDTLYYENKAAIKRVLTNLLERSQKMMNKKEPD